jgi:protease inhibitor Inh
MQRWILGIIRAGVVVVGLSALPAIAQDSSAPASDASASSLPDEVQSYAGDWVLQQEDANAPTCALTFTDEPAAGGWAVTVPDACPSPFPAASALAVWNIDGDDGSILISDGAQHVTLRLLSDPDGYYATDEDSTPRFYLVAPYEQDGEGGEQDAD